VRPTRVSLFLEQGVEASRKSEYSAEVLDRDERQRGTKKCANTNTRNGNKQKGTKLREVGGGRELLQIKVR
jgi:hypothetical protein